MGVLRGLARGIVVAGGFLAACAPILAVAQVEQGLGLPVDCDLGRECLVQQTPDMDPGPGIADPLCGHSTYDGHTGWDIRLRALTDIATDTPVIAVSHGRVLRVRDGVEDRLFSGDRAKLNGQECGNGVVVEHEDSLISQYCHLKRDSVVVRPGMTVRKGERLGAIGSSGLAEFPHVHLAIRRGDVVLDPLTGHPLGPNPPTCGVFSTSLFDPATRDQLAKPLTAILNSGLANAPPTIDALVKGPEPTNAAALGASTIGWAWAINLEAGDSIRISVAGPNGKSVVDHTTVPLPRRKASYLAFAGHDRQPGAGVFTVTVEILRETSQIAASTMEVVVE